MPKILKRLKSKVQDFKGKSQRDQKKASTKIDEIPEEKAQTLMEDKIDEPKKLVVVGKESVFSDEIIDYAIEMAERMSYEIVALNTAPLSCDTFRISSSREQICMDFKLLSEKNTQAFKEKAENRNIPFTHVIKFSESYEVLAELKKEIGEFEFVVSEEEEDSSVDGTSHGGDVQRKIFVYSMI